MFVAAFVVDNRNTKIHEFNVRLNSLYSVYQAKLVAIDLALTWYPTRYESAYLYIDNLSSLIVLQQAFSVEPLVWGIFNKLNQTAPKKNFLGSAKSSCFPRG